MNTSLTSHERVQRAFARRDHDHADGLWIYGDMAFKNMTFCSPKTYRELIWP